MQPKIVCSTKFTTCVSGWIMGKLKIIVNFYVFFTGARLNLLPDNAKGLKTLKTEMCMLKLF